MLAQAKKTSLGRLHKVPIIIIIVLTMLFKGSRRKYSKCCWGPPPLVNNGTEVTDVYAHWAYTVCQGWAKTNAAYLYSKNKDNNKE